MGYRACSYNLSLTALPHVLRHGMDFVAHLNPVWEPTGGDARSDRHYFGVDVRGTSP